MNDGDTAVNRPSTAKPANPAMAALTNTPRTCAGTATRCGRKDTVPPAGRDRLRDREQGDPDDEDQDDVHGVGQEERGRRVLGEHPREHRPEAEPEHVDRRREQAVARLAALGGEVDEGRGGRPREDPGRDPGQHAADEQASARRPG